MPSPLFCKSPKNILSPEVQQEGFVGFPRTPSLALLDSLLQDSVFLHCLSQHLVQFAYLLLIVEIDLVHLLFMKFLVGDYLLNQTLEVFLSAVQLLLQIA
jgi:hypothetical protein